MFFLLTSFSLYLFVPPFLVSFFQILRPETQSGFGALGPPSFLPENMSTSGGDLYCRGTCPCCHRDGWDGTLPEHTVSSSYLHGNVVSQMWYHRGKRVYCQKVAIRDAS